MDNREQVVPQKRASPQCIRSPQSDTSFGVVGSTNTTAQSVSQRSLQRSENLPGDMIKVMPSKILEPRSFTHDATSPTGFKTGVSGTTTQSRTVQVVDLTRRSLPDTHVAKSGIASAAPNSSRSLSRSDTAQFPKELLVNKMSAHNEVDKGHVPSIITRNGTSSTKSTLFLIFYNLTWLVRSHTDHFGPFFIYAVNCL